MKTHCNYLILLIIASSFSIKMIANKNGAIYDRYNIVWNTNSINSSGSMPVGGCDMGCNVWVEEGSLYLYVGRSGDFDENNALMKLGRLKITFFPNILSEFTQTLKLKEGLIEIKGKVDGKSVNGRIWVECERPVVHVEFDGNEKFTANVEYQTWRTEKKSVLSRWVVPSYIDYPNDVYWHPDIVKPMSDKILFYHKNDNEDLVIDREIVQQQLDDIKQKLWNPLRNYVFGGLLTGENLISCGTTTGTYLHTPYKAYCMKTKSNSRKFRLDLIGFSGYFDNAADYEKALYKSYLSGISASSAFKKHQAYWNEFWNRSYIVLNGDNNNPNDSVWQVGRNYNLFRYQMGCNAKGEYPTKFNGGLFTFDTGTIDKSFENDNPDFRAWGGGVMTAQNQRLLYWPLLKSGDTDIMTQQFDFYSRALNNAELKVDKYWGHKGACYVDQMNQSSLACGREYGWNRPKDFDPATQYTPYHSYYFTSQLEFAYMILEYYRFSGKDISRYIPFIKSSIAFFDEHYRYLSKKNTGSELSKDGKYNIYPSQALETYVGEVKNPADITAALTRLAKEMQLLPDKYVSEKEKRFYKDMESKLPAIPFRNKNGHKTISPAETWQRIINCEIPQLYPVFPWGIYGLNQPDIEIAIDTWKYGTDNPDQKNHISWHQDAIFCARLGLVDEASNITIKKLRDADRRYPTFWGPGHDWVPDHNWGGSGMIGLQEMLMQTPGKDIFLFPAWPNDWNVKFKLLAPYNTIVQGEYKDGKLIDLNITPKSRKRDVKILIEDK